MSAQLDNAEMRTLAIIARRITTRDSSGFRGDELYQVAYRPRGAWRPVKGAQAMEQAVLGKRTAGIFRTRYASGITETMKIRISGQWYDISTVVSDERRRWIEIHCERQVTPQKITIAAQPTPS